MNPLRVAVIGCGAMGRNHARVWSQTEGAELIGVCDTDRARAEAVASEFNVTPFCRVWHLLDRFAPDAVSIAVPTTEHSSVASDCIVGCAHVLVEKPLAATSAEARDLVTKAVLARRVLAVGHIERYNPAVQRLRQQMEAGEVGRILEARCRRVGPPRLCETGRVGLYQRDTGVTLDLAVHDLDLVRWLLGEEPSEVRATTMNEECSPFDDLVVAALTFPSGIKAGLSANWLFAVKERTLCLLTDKGTCRVDLLNKVYEAEDGWMQRFDHAPFLPEPLAAEIDAFARACRGESAEIVTGEDGLRAVVLAEALLESAREGRVVSLA